MVRGQKLERLLWSIAFPGFGQLLNRKYIKGVLLIALEVIINLQSHLNKVIQCSFTGDIGGAIAETDYQWLMFYPCVYMFGIWDAYRDADDEQKPFAFLPFVFAAFFATAGLIFSPYLLGPVWLALIFCFIGVGVGIFLRKMISH
ncbi:hypothetical protein HZF08_12350 [Paenibacillus sp. CGMCC 1.16610]|uniref:Uncharacterized protein n=1 Tax=Paenibacillus anseongense TaxID=2682845 RepID=A0ABW9U4P2_9BACL|nr:hypothetical protein [Paenibacillus anseongense]MBA2939098.1 hypothetical protein [Paenibacillus sp. CGMCC 1.16610]MVQ35057.1 hypothetical protein [Paenibacillus anseongense]